MLYLVTGDVAPLKFEVPDNGDEEFGEAIFSAGVLPEPMLHGHDGRDGDLVHSPSKSSEADEDIEGNHEVMGSSRGTLRRRRGWMK